MIMSLPFTMHFSKKAGFVVGFAHGIWGFILFSIAFGTSIGLGFTLHRSTHRRICRCRFLRSRNGRLQHLYLLWHDGELCSNSRITFVTSFPLASGGNREKNGLDFCFFVEMTDNKQFCQSDHGMDAMRRLIAQSRGNLICRHFLSRCGHPGQVEKSFENNHQRL